MREFNLVNRWLTYVLLSNILLARLSLIDTGSGGNWLITPGISLMLHKLTQLTSEANRHQIQICTKKKDLINIRK